MIVLITAAFFVAGFVCAEHAVLTTRTSTGAIAWSVSLVSVPFIAVPAYLVFGRNKFEGMVDAYEARQEEIDELATGMREGQSAYVYPAPDRPSVYRSLKALSRLASPVL